MITLLKISDADMIPRLRDGAWSGLGPTTGQLRADFDRCAGPFADAA
jgi:hypothetical protein